MLSIHTTTTTTASTRFRSSAGPTAGRLVRGWLALSVGACLLATASMAFADETLDKIQRLKALSIGVLIGGDAFGSLDPATQRPVGYQVDLAQEVAKRLGVQAQIVPVTTATRVQFLQSGKVDLLLASFVRTPEREELLSIVPTPYYQSGGMLLTRKNSGIDRLDDVRGKTICVSQGSSFAKPLEQQHGAIIKGLKSSSESLLVLRGGACAGAVHASTVIAPLFEAQSGKAGEEWSDFRIAVSDIDPAPWVAAARKGERNFTAALDQVFRQLHAEGFFIATERKYRILPHAKALDAWRQQFGQ